MTYFKKKQAGEILKRDKRDILEKIIERYPFYGPVPSFL